MNSKSELHYSMGTYSLLDDCKMFIKKAILGFLSLLFLFLVSQEWQNPLFRCTFFFACVFCFAKTLLVTSKNTIKNVTFDNTKQQIIFRHNKVPDNRYVIPYFDISHIEIKLVDATEDEVVFDFCAIKKNKGVFWFHEARFSSSFYKQRLEEQTAELHANTGFHIQVEREGFSYPQIKQYQKLSRNISKIESLEYAVHSELQRWVANFALFILWACYFIFVCQINDISYLMRILLFIFFVVTCMLSVPLLAPIHSIKIKKGKKTKIIPRDKLYLLAYLPISFPPSFVKRISLNHNKQQDFFFEVLLEDSLNEVQRKGVKNIGAFYSEFAINSYKLTIYAKTIAKGDFLLNELQSMEEFFLKIDEDIANNRNEENLFSTELENKKLSKLGSCNYANKFTAKIPDEDRLSLQFARYKLYGFFGKINFTFLDEGVVIQGQKLLQSRSFLLLDFLILLASFSLFLSESIGSFWIFLFVSFALSASKILRNSNSEITVPLASFAKINTPRKELLGNNAEIVIEVQVNKEKIKQTLVFEDLTQAEEFYKTFYFFYTNENGKDISMIDSPSS
ncbi:hypothetical protein [Candidatus Uabimicrobium amorphum]|uniref:Uncharacterized protein n=1 Tax=Uabimicrobium amorphum TaxID=2596890 RepID=A0A5S9IQB7_UABAM|nr:hypothetical protein [Candidatus Uabimicrobium amorphum]BBM86128.1 hypothetical protein UABAM_04514 [Candidatus Uabimicrobium amorphum]